MVATKIRTSSTRGALLVVSATCGVAIDGSSADDSTCSLHAGGGEVWRFRL